MSLRLALSAAILVTFSVAADDWPQWMGPHRDDVWAETGIIEEFPASGPKFVWRKPIQGGFAGPAVADGKVYVCDYLKSAGDDKPEPTKRNDLQGKERVLCL